MIYFLLSNALSASIHLLFCSNRIRSWINLPRLEATRVLVVPQEVHIEPKAARKALTSYMSRNKVAK